MFLAILVLTFAVTGIVAISLQLADKNNKTVKLLTYSPSVSTVLFGITSLIFLLGRTSNGYNSYLDHYTNWGFFVLLGLLIASSALSILIALNKLKD